jgi:hypothetical protein
MFVTKPSRPTRPLPKLLASFMIALLTALAVPHV